MTHTATYYQLGSGGFGFVVLRRRATLPPDHPHRDVAVKCFYARKDADHEALRHVVTKTLNLAGILNRGPFLLHTYGGDPQLYVLYTAYAPYGTVHDAITRARQPSSTRILSFACAHQWLHQLAQALQYMHANNLVHGDVTPSNLFLDGPCTPYPTLKLGDYDNMETADNQFTCEDALGKVGYCPPERVYRRGSDMFQWGCVAANVLSTHHKPFPMHERGSELHAKRWLLRHAPPLLHVTASLASACMSCNLSERWSAEYVASVMPAIMARLLGSETSGGGGSMPHVLGPPIRELAKLPHVALMVQEIDLIHERRTPVVESSVAEEVSMERATYCHDRRESMWSVNETPEMRHRLLSNNTCLGEAIAFAKLRDPGRYDAILSDASQPKYLRPQHAAQLILLYSLYRPHLVYDVVVRGGRLYELPASLCCLSHLHTLQITDSTLQELPSNLSRCRMLTLVDVSHNELRQLPNLSGLVRLLGLYVAHNPLTSLPESVGELPDLAVLDVSFTELEVGMEHFPCRQTWPALQLLDMRHCGCSNDEEVQLRFRAQAHVMA